MTTAIEIVALLLPPDDREVVLGDLEEQKQPGWIGFIAVLGFVIRRQAEYWRNWRPWVVGGLVIPATLLLLGTSFRLSMDFRNLWHEGYFREPLPYEAALTIAWAWAGGFVIGALSRRTGWASPLLFTIPCLFCLLEFREPSLNSLCLFLFLPSGILGALLGQRWMRLPLAPSLVLALSTISAMLLWRDMPSLNWMLLLPALYLAWTSARPNETGQGTFT
jgi:hypothetical protein